MIDTRTAHALFSGLVTDYTRDFVGREWIVEEVCRRLDDPDCRWLVLTGPPGVGKTALLAHIAAIHPTWLRYFIRRDSHDVLYASDAATFFLTIGAQFATLYPEAFSPENVELTARQQIGEVTSGSEAVGVYVAKLRASPFYKIAVQAEQQINRVEGRAVAIQVEDWKADRSAFSLQELLALGLLDPAKRLQQTHPDVQITIIVDALDEVRYTHARPDIQQALIELPNIPENVRLIISSRPDPSLRLLLGRRGVRELPLNVDSKENRIDLQTYASKRMEQGIAAELLETERLSAEEVIDCLLDKAAGNFLYLKSVLNELEQAHTTSRSSIFRLDDLPPSLAGLYGCFLSLIVQWAEESGAYRGAWRNYLAKLLGLLAAAREPMEDQVLASVTGIRLQEVRDLLRDLRQFIERLDGAPPTYRIFHASFADFLFKSDHNQDYWIDEDEQNSLLVDFYLGRWGGLEAALPALPTARTLENLDLYGVRHLGAHLEAARRTEDLHALLAVTTPSQGNTWFQIKEALSDVVGYREDVTRAWRFAEEASKRSGAAFAAVHQFRYALMLCSINSLSTNIHPSLLVRLVTSGLWTPAQGLTYAQSIRDPSPRVRAFLALADALPEMQRPGIFRKTLAEFRNLEEESMHQRVTCTPVTVIRALPRDLLEEARVAAKTLRWHRSRVLVLGELTAHLPEPERHSVLMEAWKLAIRHGTGLVVDLIPYVHESEWAVLLQEALSIACAQGTPDQPMITLRDLMPYLARTDCKQVLCDWFAAARELPSQFEEERVKLMICISSLLPEPERSQAIREALATVALTDSPSLWVHAVKNLTPHLGEEEQNLLCQTALAFVKVIPDLYQRVKNLTDIVPNLTPTQLSEVVTTAASASHDIVFSLPDLLVALARTLTEDKHNEILCIAEAIVDSDVRANSLCHLIPYLSESILPAAEDLIRTVPQDNPRRAQALKSLALRFDFKRALLLEEALDCIGHTRSDYIEAFLLDMVPYAPKSLLPKVLTTAEAISNAYILADFIPQLAALLPKPERTQALRIARAQAEAIPSSLSRGITLMKLAIHFHEPERQEILREVLSLTQTMTLEEGKIPTMMKLIQLLPKEKKLAVVEQEIKPLLRQKPQVFFEFQSDLANHIPDYLLPDALAAARWIKDERDQAKFLSALTPVLPDSQLTKIWDQTRQIENAEDRADILIELSSRIPEPDRYQVIQEALTAVEASQRGDLLRRLTPLLTEASLPRVLTIARKLQSPKMNSEIVAELAPNLTPELCWEAFESTLSEPKHPSRVGILTKLILRIPDRVLTSAVEHIWTISAKEGFVTLFLALLRRQPFILISKIQVLMQRQDFCDCWKPLLPELVPYLSDSQRSQFLIQAVQTVRQGSNPAGFSGPNESGYRYVDDLLSLLPYLRESERQPIVEEAFERAWNIQPEFSRNHFLVSLLPYLTNSERRQVMVEVLENARSIESPSNNGALSSTNISPTNIDVLKSLLAYMRGSERTQLQKKIIFLIKALPANGPRAKGLLDLTFSLHRCERQPLFLEALDSFMEENQKGYYELDAEETIANIINLLSDENLLKAWQMINAFPCPQLRILALNALSLRLPDPQRLTAVRQALTAVRDLDSIRNHYGWETDPEIRYWERLAPQLPEPILQEMLATISILSKKNYWGYRQDSVLDSILKNLIPCLSPKLAAEALAFVKNMPTSKQRIPLMSALSLQLPEKESELVILEVLSLLITIRDRDDRVSSAIAIATNLEQTLQTLYPYWSQITFPTNSCTRADFMAIIGAMLPWISVSAGPETITEIFRAMYVTTDWWP